MQWIKCRDDFWKSQFFLVGFFVSRVVLSVLQCFAGVCLHCSVLQCVLQCVAVCRSVLQCGAVCCSVVQCTAVCCSASQCVAVCRRVLQCVAVCCSVWQCVAACCSMLQCVAVCCSVLQCVAVFAMSCSVLQCVAVCCSVSQCVAVCRSVLQCFVSVLCFALALMHCWNASNLPKKIVNSQHENFQKNFRENSQMSPLLSFSRVRSENSQYSRIFFVDIWGRKIHLRKKFKNTRTVYFYLADFLTCYRLTKRRRMPYFYRSLPAKEPYNLRVFCKKISAI